MCNFREIINLKPFTNCSMEIKPRRLQLSYCSGVAYSSCQSFGIHIANILSFRIMDSCLREGGGGGSCSLLYLRFSVAFVLNLTLSYIVLSPPSPPLIYHSKQLVPPHILAFLELQKRLVSKYLILSTSSLTSASLGGSFKPNILLHDQLLAVLEVKRHNG